MCAFRRASPRIRKATRSQTALEQALARARVDIQSWEQDGERVLVRVTSSKPIDERVTRYLDRSNTFRGRGC